jgi:hypothetical protein
MIPNKSSVVDIDSYKTEKNIEIKGKDSYFSESYYITQLFDEKESKEFLKSVERLVRSSKEYTHYLGKLKGMEMNRCAILGNVEEDEKVTIEFHHYPFTLFDICWIVLDKKLDKKEYVNTFLVAKEVLDLHFKNKVGLVPLCKTVHELVHSGEIFVNLNLVYGYYDKFVEEYSDYIPDELKNNYNQLIEWTEKKVPYSANDILHIHEH